MEMPNLIKVQLDSYDWFIREGLRELLDEISPIQDFTGSKMELRFGEYSFGEPKYDERESRDRDATYAVPLRVRVELIVKETGEVKEQELFMGDFPLMTPTGTFIINGAERVVVSQLVRSPGVYFTREKDPTTGRDLAFAKVIPNRGAWLEFETSNRDVISVKVDRKRKIPVTTLLRAIDSMENMKDSELGTAERILTWFDDVDTNADHHYIATTLEKETPEVKVGNKLRALEDFYKRMRPGDPPTLENARTLVNSLFFNARRYDLLKVGRYKINRRLKQETSMDTRVLTVDDIKGIIHELIRLNNGQGDTDEIDHLGNRRVRAVGELIQNQFRIGLLRMERVVRERMTITDPDQATPSALINIRPVVAAMKEFFGGSQLSQFMDQTNPLAELTHKRKLSALGPGGLSRDHAGFDVRDVHHSHYGRICPIETPEGPNIGLIVSLASFAVINDYGFIETPYRRVIRELPADSADLIGRLIREDVVADGKKLAKAGDEVTAAVAKKLAPLGVKHVKVRPFASTDILYLAADDEEQYVIAQANAIIDANGHFLEEEVEIRKGQRFEFTHPDEIDFMDVSPKQILSTATSLIPFLEHDDAPRALMGSNMQRQAVPLVHPERPLVGTGTERQVAVDSGQVVVATGDGLVTAASARGVTVRYDDGEEVTHPVLKFIRSNAATCLNQRPAVTKGDRIAKGDTLVDSSSTDDGELALGQSVLCAFMSWEGYNFEDAIIISESVVRDDKFTSIHIEKHEIEARDTKLGPEEITRDIPNVGDESLKDLDDEGIIRIGAEVQAGDILVGKITPKGETELTAEEKLLRAIFGEKAREVKDTSLRVPHGQHGKVIDVRVFRREEHDELPAGVNQLVRVSIAQKRKVSEGDKMAGRHGNKGVIARILPVEDMPYLADGTPVDIILNPIGVPSRMNVGQVLETHLGWAASVLGFRAITPVFDGAEDHSIEDALARAWLAVEAGAIEAGINGNSSAPWGENLNVPVMETWLKQKSYDFQTVFDETKIGEAKRACLELWLESIGEKVKRGKELHQLEKIADEVTERRRIAAPVFGKQTIFDGRNGEPFDQPVTVGQIYMLKLVHLVEEKIHARSTGPYSLITQQPLGGKAQMGGQRFGEMEVWALEAYGAAHTLQELLTVKSDDVVGRVKTYEAIVKGDDVLEPGIPESFKVLVKELQSLGLAVEVLNEDEEQVVFADDGGEDVPQIGINLTGFESEDILSDRGIL
ncbi:MAG: DNA-directed RNA polymerase subunit beta [Dehalococcoidia bacterium]|nr:DNA-directed RNA polymerase subunit beta [Dehalococcoidia bacterium]